MDVREKMVELIFDSLCRNINKSCKLAESIADDLLSNGVTVQEWISVDDRLPTTYDADDDNCVLAIHKESNKMYYHWRSVADNPFDFTYWTRTPQPPKGE